MKIKKFIKESVIIDNITSIDEELREIKKTLLKKLQKESRNKQKK